MSFSSNESLDNVCFQSPFFKSISNNPTSLIGLLAIATNRSFCACKPTKSLKGWLILVIKPSWERREIFQLPWSQIEAIIFSSLEARLDIPKTHWGEAVSAFIGHNLCQIVFWSECKFISATIGFHQPVRSSETTSLPFANHKGWKIDIGFSLYESCPAIKEHLEIDTKSFNSATQSWLESQGIEGDCHSTQANLLLWECKAM